MPPLAARPQPVSHWASAPISPGASCPIYLKALAIVPAPQVLAHRILWSLLLVAGSVAVMRRGAALAALLRAPRTIAVLAFTASLIGGQLAHLHLGGQCRPRARNQPRLLHHSLGQCRARRNRAPRTAPPRPARRSHASRDRRRRPRHRAGQPALDLARAGLQFQLLRPAQEDGSGRSADRAAWRNLSIWLRSASPICCGWCQRVAARSAHRRRIDFLLDIERPRHRGAAADVRRCRQAPALRDHRPASVHRPDDSVPAGSAAVTGRR